MSRRLRLSFVAAVAVSVVALIVAPSLVGATFTHPEDTHYEARIPKSSLVATASGVVTEKALPMGLSAKHRVDPHAPTDASFFAAGFTDEHHRPIVRFTLENGALVKVSVSFPAPHTLAMPAFTVKVLTVRADHTIPSKYYLAKRQRTSAEDAHDENEGLSFAERSHEVVMEETLVTPGAQSDAANFALHDPTPMEDLYDYVVAIINVHPRVITSFVYELDAIPDKLFKSEKMYDLVPFNSTMNMKFVARYDAATDAVGVWIVRRPPIPDFTFLITVDGRVELQENIATPNPSGQGFPLAIPHASSRRKGLYRFVVHFYERPRQRHTCFPIDKGFSSEVRRTLSGPRNVRKFIDRRIPSAEGFSLRFTNDNHRDTLTVSLVQANPISSLMISLYAAFDGTRSPYSVRIPMPDEGEGDDEYEDDPAAAPAAEAAAAVAERPILIFREEEHHVPFIAPTEAGQFGWYSALPMTEDAILRLADARNSGVAARASSRKVRSAEGPDGEEDEDDVAADVPDASLPIDQSRIEKMHLSACVSFNDKAGLTHPFDEMGEWIYDFGGDTRKMMTVSTTAYSPAEGNLPPQSAAIAKPASGRFTKANQGLAAREDIPIGEEVATIPYRVLLTTTTVEGNEWVAEVMRNATYFVTQCVELGMEVQQNQHFMLMTFFLLMQPSSVFDGTNWRQYFDTIPLDTRPFVPIFYSYNELALFSFAPLVAEHVRTLQALIEAEYRTIASQVPWFEAEVNRERYAIARSQVENRVFNISGTLVMIPAIDYLGHADDPSIALAFDDKDQFVRLQARSAIPSGGALTIDYGIEVRNKFDFLTQFGFIPKAAANVAGLRIKRYKQRVADEDEFTNVFLLATSRDSRHELAVMLREDLAAAKGVEEGDSVDPSMITQSELRSAFVALLKRELAAMPSRDTIDAEGLAASDSRIALLAPMAHMLYDGHRAALEEHIRWATDSKVPL